MEAREEGLVPAGKGWFVLNAAEAQWMTGAFGAYTRFEGDERFPLVGVNIGNATPEYPHGDNVQTVERWYPPSITDQTRDALSKTNLAAIFDQIRQGPEPGEFYRPDPRTNGGDRVGCPVCEITGLDKGEADRLVRDWLKNDVLLKSEYVSPKRKRQVTRITLNEVKAAEILG